MTSAEIVKALREECKTCSEIAVCMNGTNLAGFYCATSDAADLIERLEKEKADAQWIPVTERLPDYEKRVLTMDKWGHITDRMLLKFMSGKDYFTPDGMYPHKDIKYWMPLPKAPEVDL